MARAYKRSSEATEKRRKPPVARRQAAVMRSLEDPLGLVRTVRCLAALADRDIDKAEWNLVIEDVLYRCAAIDPSFQAMTEDEIADMRQSTDPSEHVESHGVKQVALSSLDPDGQFLVSRVGEIRAAVNHIASIHRLSAAAAVHLRRLAASLLELVADPTFPLAPQEQRIWDLLLGQPEDRPLTCPSIIARLRTSGGMLSETNAKKSLRGNLKKKGVRNRKRAGYYIPSEFRPAPDTKK